MVLVVMRPLPTPGWPPDGWVMVACDVGQGDGLVLRGDDRGGGRRGTGSSPDRPVPGPAGRGTGASGGADPLPRRPRRGPARGAGGPGGWRGPGDRAPRPGAGRCLGGPRLGLESGVPIRVAGVQRGEPGRGLTWQVVGPSRESAARVRRGGSPANNASVTLLVVTHGIGSLLTGDPSRGRRSCSAGRRRTCGSTCSVPHGSRYQDPALLSSLGARLALISVGEDSEYGHPAPETLDLLEDAGSRVRRTDESRTSRWWCATASCPWTRPADPVVPG